MQTYNTWHQIQMYKDIHFNAAKDVEAARVE